MKLKIGLTFLAGFTTCVALLALVAGTLLVAGPVAAQGPVELSGAATLVDRRPVAMDGGGGGLRRSARTQNPLAAPILGLGLALLTMAGVLLGRAGQGIA